MATSALVLTNGVGRMTSIQPLIYDQSIEIVASGATGNQLVGPITSGTAITLPASGSYTLNANSVANLQVYLNGDRVEQTFDWTTSGAGPTFTAIQFTFNIVVSDRIDLRIDRTS